MTKLQARRRVKAALALIPATELARRGGLAVARLLRARWWGWSDVVLTYLSMPGEIDTSPVVAAALSEGKQVAVPAMEGPDLSFRLVTSPVEGLPRDRYGIPLPDPSWPRWTAEAERPGPPALSPGTPQPAEARPLRVLVVTPGLAFDRSLARLGRGKGYYDRFLALLRDSPGVEIAAVAIALQEQLLEEVPHDERDVPLDGIVTDQETIPT